MMGLQKIKVSTNHFFSEFFPFFAYLRTIQISVCMFFIFYDLLNIQKPLQKFTKDHLQLSKVPALKLKNIENPLFNETMKKSCVEIFFDTNDRPQKNQSEYNYFF